MSKEIEAMFDSAMPEDFLRESVSLLIKVFRDTRNEARSRFTHPHDRYIWGHLRWATFDREWHILAKQFAPHGVSAAYQSNKRRNFEYTEVRAGRVIMLAAAVDDRMKFVRHSDFRETIAQMSNPTLFETPKKPPADAPLCAFLIYGAGNIKFTHFPAFMDIVFPDRDQNRYAHRIRLFDRFYPLVDGERSKAAQAAKAEEVPDTLEPELNENIQQKREESA